MIADRFYTPVSVARDLVSFSTGKPARIADFCVGDGSLVRAAAERWKETQFYICDIDGAALLAAKQSSRVEASLCFDFLSSDFPVLPPPFEESRFDLILMNPPFSNRGGRLCAPRGTFSFLKCSRALAFLLTAFDYLADDGEIIAILPSSALSSEQDEGARMALVSVGRLEVLSQPRYGAFPRVDASTVIVRLKRGKSSLRNESRPSSLAQDASGAPSIVRGKISVRRSMRTESSTGLGWVHTTSIVGGEIQKRYEFPAGIQIGNETIAAQYAVLIPRVGRVRPESIVVVHSSRGEVISDCLLAIECGGLVSAQSLRRRMIRDFHHFRLLYSGTGAPYVTTGRLKSYLLELEGPHL
ncbi:MAG: methyltransferase [Rhodobacteraceae bacterium]|nr:methyltransferase [Paracoccaceae bacterium]